MYEIAVVGAGGVVVVGGGCCWFRVGRGIRVWQDWTRVGLYPGSQFDVLLVEPARWVLVVWDPVVG